MQQPYCVKFPSNNGIFLHCGTSCLHGRPEQYSLTAYNGLTPASSVDNWWTCSLLRDMPGSCCKQILPAYPCWSCAMLHADVVISCPAALDFKLELQLWSHSVTKSHCLCQWLVACSALIPVFLYPLLRLFPSRGCVSLCLCVSSCTQTHYTKFEIITYKKYCRQLKVRDMRLKHLIRLVMLVKGYLSSSDRGSGPLKK